jgi:hypothetical protein
LEKAMREGRHAEKMKFESIGYLIDAQNSLSSPAQYFSFLQKTFLRSSVASEDTIPELLLEKRIPSMHD